MKQILWIDACVREASRTRKLAEHILSKLDGTVTRVDLNKEQIPPLTDKMLTYRSRKAEEQDFSDPVFTFFKAKEIKITTDGSFDWTLDGEFEKGAKEINITN